MKNIINFILRLKFKFPSQKKIIIFDKYLPQYLDKKILKKSFCIHYRKIDYYFNIILLMIFKNIFYKKENILKH